MAIWVCSADWSPDRVGKRVLSAKGRNSGFCRYPNLFSYRFTGLRFIISYQGFIYLVNGVIPCSIKRERNPKVCLSDDDLPRKWSFGSLFLVINLIPNRSAVHKNDRVMPVFANDRCGKAGNIFCFALPRDDFETSR